MVVKGTRIKGRVDTPNAPPILIYLGLSRGGVYEGRRAAFFLVAFFFVLVQNWPFGSLVGGR